MTSEQSPGGGEPDLFDLTGKVAVVTGGSRGLGREMSVAFAARGAVVVVASRKVEPCRALAAEITAATGQEALGLGCHVGRWEDCQQLADTVSDRFGRLDILVNNAGMSPLYPSLLDVDQDLYDKVLAVNLRGPFRLCVLAGTLMAARDGGSIINVSSTAAVEPSPGSLPYAAAKAGLNCLTIGLARAFGPTVRVNGIMPGPFLTDISHAWDMEAFEERARQSIALERGGQPNEIVGAALYLASAASSFTTGAIIKVDGGAAFAAS
jgi:NAD(P)-dependent dehydrogenase (short-subunit alcohol dehydrogenase family)